MKALLISLLFACALTSTAFAQSAPISASNTLVSALVLEELQAKDAAYGLEVATLRGRAARSEEQRQAAVTRARRLAQDNAIYRSAFIELFPAGADMSPREAAAALANLFIELAALQEDLARSEAALQSQTSQLTGYREATKRALAATLNQAQVSIAAGRVGAIQGQLDIALDMARQLSVDLDDEAPASRAEGRRTLAMIAALGARSAFARTDYALAATRYGEAALSLNPIADAQDVRREYLVDQTNALFRSGSVEDLAKAIELEQNEITPLSHTPATLAWSRNAVAVYLARLALIGPAELRNERLRSALQGYDTALQLMPEADPDRDAIIVNRTDVLFSMVERRLIEPGRFFEAIRDLTLITQRVDSPSWAHASIALAGKAAVQAQYAAAAQPGEAEPPGEWLDRAEALYLAVQRKHSREATDGFWEMSELGLAYVDFVRGRIRSDRRLLIRAISHADMANAGWVEQGSQPSPRAFLLKAEAMYVLARRSDREARRWVPEALDVVAEGLALPRLRDPATRNDLLQLQGRLENFGRR